MSSGGLGKQYPSTVGVNHGTPGLAVASSNCSAESALNSPREGVLPGVNPDANFTPTSSASAKGFAACVAMIDPLSPMAPAIHLRESGEAICALTEIEPADSPAIVTR